MSGQRIFFSLLKLMGFRFAQRQLRRKVILVYLRALEGTRKSLLLVLFIAMLFQVMVIGLIGCIYGAIVAWPNLDSQTRIVAVLVTSAVLFVVPLLIFLTLLSDRLWLRLSGVQRLLKEP